MNKFFITNVRLINSRLHTPPHPLLLESNRFLFLAWQGGTMLILNYEL